MLFKCSIITIVLTILIHETSGGFWDCLGEVAVAVLSNLCGKYDYDYDYRRMLDSDEELNSTDLKAMIENELTKVYQGEPIIVDPEIKKLVHEAVKKLPKELVKELEAEFNGYQNQSQDGSDIEVEPSQTRRYFDLCSDTLIYIARVIFCNKDSERKKGPGRHKGHRGNRGHRAYGISKPDV